MLTRNSLKHLTFAGGAGFQRFPQLRFIVPVPATVLALISVNLTGLKLLSDLDPFSDIPLKLDVTVQPPALSVANGGVSC
jgi:hypothetical protein